MASLPLKISGAPLRTFRPRDLDGVYTQPSVQLHRLSAQGRVRKAAHGVYYAPPDDVFPSWRPEIETVAIAVATAHFGDRVPVLMHLSAARLHGTAPRALAVAIIAAPRQHARIQLDDRDDGTLVFVRRDTDTLDAELVRTELGPALVTGVEQTALDLVRRPDLVELPTDALDAARGLLPRCDPEVLDRLADDRRNGRATLQRLRRLLEPPTRQARR